MYSSNQPELVILLGARTIVSLLGMIATFVGHWNWERVHEREDNGTAAGEHHEQHQGEEGGGVLTKSSAMIPSSPRTNSRRSLAIDPEGQKLQSVHDATPSATTPSSGRSLWNWKGLKQTLGGGDDTAAPVDHPTSTATATTTTSTSITPYTLQTTSPTKTSTAVEPLETDAMASTHQHQTLFSPLHTLLATMFTSSLHMWSIVTSLGWILLSISCLMNPKTYSGLQLTGFSISSMMVTLLLGLMQYVYHHDHVERQNLPPYVCGYAFMHVIVWSLLVVLSNEALHTLNWAPFLGSILILCSYVVSWFSKRHGGSYLYLKTGKLNPRPVVFHLGGPLLVWGYWMIWIGMNGVPGNPDTWYLPIYLGSRTAVSYTFSTIIILVLWSTSYAYDEYQVPNVPAPMDKYGLPIVETTAQRFESLRLLLLSGPGFGCGGYFVGAVWEIKLLLTLVWVVLGLTVFLPTMESLWPFGIFIVLCLCGVTHAIFYEIAIRAIGTPDVVKRWALNSLGMLVVLALCLSMEGSTAALLAIPGVLLLWMGQSILHHDRKKGHTFIVMGQVNPNPKVFSYGGPVTTLGMTLLAWSLSLRY